MSNFKVGKSRFVRFINGKGFYIALALCLVAIGSAAYIAANKSFRSVSNLSSSSALTASGGSAANAIDWGDSEAEQTNNTVSGVMAGGSSSSATSSSTASSAASSKASSAASSKTSSSTAAPTLYVLPLEGSLVTDYSPDEPIFDKTMNDWRVHDGVDIAANAGTPVKACADGTVLDVKTDDQLGQEVIIQHGGGITSIYANLAANPTVKKGQTVEAGDVIGSVGSTAQAEIGLVPHLHFAMMKNSQYVDPMVTIGKKSS